MGPEHDEARERPSAARAEPGQHTTGGLPAPGVSNAALARMAAAGAGMPLPSNATAAVRALGARAGDVRIHTGAEADARLADRPDALAVTQGTDIHVGSNAPSLEGPGGELLLAHEAVHVVQQDTRGTPVARERSEEEADRAAVSAVAGGPLPTLSAAAGPMYFEARWHQASLTGAMSELGFSDEEQQAAYFANWARDLSQALVPIARGTIGTQAAFQFVNLLSIHKFGHGITPSQLGAYDPRQHIDNPAGTTQRDVLPGGVDIGGYSGIDPITGQPAGHAGATTGEELTPARIGESFAVNAAGVPAYMERSKDYITEEANAALDAGRTQQGLFHVGNLSHTVEDLFAHSNWIEIAIGRLITEGVVPVPSGEAGDEVQERLEQGKPPIETFAAEVRDQAGNARPILSTGTFTGFGASGAGHDTLISIKSEAQNLLRDREPFKEDGGGGEMYDFAIEVLRHVDQSAEEGALGDIFVEVVEQAISNVGDAALGGLAGLPGAARERLGTGFLGNVASGAAELLNEGAQDVAGLAGEAWQSTVRGVLRDIVNDLGPAIKLAEVAVYLKGGVNAISRAWDQLKKDVRKLPDAIVELILPKLIEAEREFKRRLRQLGNAAYGRAVELLMDALEGIAPTTDAAETNVDLKLGEWQEQLDEMRRNMARLLREVGGEDGAALAAQVEGMQPDQLIGLADSTAFQRILNGLAENVIARVRLTSAVGDLGDKANQVAQLSNVPEWARAGASHSQLAKDHDDSAFFGIAFTVARQADHLVLSAIQDAWMMAGDVGPAPGLGGNFGRDKTGAVTDEGISDSERRRRQEFLEIRDAGETVLAEGHAETMDVGPRLVALAEGLEAIIEHHPILDPTLSGLVWLMRQDPELEELVTQLETTRAEWEAMARSGELDDMTIEAVDQALGRVSRFAGIMGRDEEGHEHPADLHHPRESEDHQHGARTETFYKRQIDTLDKYRGPGASDEMVRPEVRAPIELDERGLGPPEEADIAADPRDRLHAEIERIFGHPYDSNWWVPTVSAWCSDHPDLLERAIHDRNEGVMHSHVH